MVRRARDMAPLTASEAGGWSHLAQGEGEGWQLYHCIHRESTEALKFPFTILKLERSETKDFLFLSFDWSSGRIT